MESILGILVCGVKVWASVDWLGGRRSRRQRKGEKERKRKERRKGEKGQRVACRGPTQLAGTEASPIRISQAVPSACGRTFLRAAGGQGQWPAPGPLLARSSPACGPAGVGTVTVAKCANLCHCPQAKGSHGDWLI